MTATFSVFMLITIMAAATTLTLCIGSALITIVSRIISKYDQDE